MTNYVNVKAPLINSHGIIKHHIIIWLDSDINHANENTKNSFHNIRHIIDSIKRFITINECIDFLQTITNEHVFMIIADSFHQQDIPLLNLIEQTTQIDSVYIISNDPSKSWVNQCRKFQGIFPDIEHIFDALECHICSSDIDSSMTSIVCTIDDNLDELDQSYIYSKLLTEIIFKIEYDEKIKKESFDSFREDYTDNKIKLKEIDEFERDYQQYSPIWWYKKESIINSLIKDALITQNIDMMIKMGVFIRDLHREIKQIHSEMNQMTKFIVYRGQGMSIGDFEKFIKRKGGLYTFYNFISTSTHQETALQFANRAKLDLETIGILFQMEIDPLLCSIPFASLDNTSYYLEAENEILFSTHTTFRIGEMNEIEDRLWKVNLTLTRDIDQQSQSITSHIRNEILNITAWHSLAVLLYKMGKYDIAKDIFNRICEITDDNNNKGKSITALASTYNNIGLMNDSMGNYSDALSLYKSALEIQLKSLPSDHPLLATVYNNIGMAYRSIGDYINALLYCEKTLEIRLKSSSVNQTSLATAYSNIGMVYESKGDYSTALSYYEKTYEIQKSSLPPHHPSFTLSYNNFGGINSLLGHYSTALSYYNKTFEIQEKFLPSNHPSIATTYNNIGHVYQLMGKYTTSLSYYQDALEIQIVSLNQLELATTYNNIGLVYRLMEQYSIALSYYEKTLKIEENALNSDHPSLAFTYNNLGTLNQAMGKYSTGLSYYEKTLNIWQKSLPQDHPLLATIHNNIGSVYDAMREYKQALTHYEKAVEIQQKLPSFNQLHLATTYNNIGEVYRSMKDYTNALSYYRRTLEIEEKHLSTNHPSLAITVTNMAVALDANKQYQEAFEHAERALDIFCDAFGPNHSQTKQNQLYLNEIHQKLLSVE